jgi:hypothetical protein
MSGDILIIPSAVSMKNKYYGRTFSSIVYGGRLATGSVASFAGIGNDYIL